MSTQLRPIGTIALASAIIALSLRIGMPANDALADDCLTAPNSPVPPNGHWYYRTDRTQDRKCWHLQTDNGHSEQAAMQTAREATAKASQSIEAGGPYAGARFKESVTHQAAAKLSDEDVEKLYAEFLEWRRHTKN
jgi:hypothetical protein